MTPLDHLLFRRESESLDFKRDQYPFVGASDDQKAKLLKDILAFANSWRGETAYILIGVDAPLGSPPQVMGITHHIDDASLQQFVNAKTQRTLEFRYFETELCGKTVGVIEIPVQRRPLYLTSNFAGVKANVVYTRRGSSNAEASPDEVARMGSVTQELSDCDLEVAFAVPMGRDLIGPSLDVQCVTVSLDEGDDIPDYSEGDGYFRTSVTGNRHFWRDLVEYSTTTALARPAALTVSNRGKSAARGVRVEFAVDDPESELHFIADSEMPTLPSKHFYGAIGSMPSAIAAAMKGPPFEAEYVDGVWHVAFNIGTLQPARTLFPAIHFYVGSEKSKSIEIAGRILAENLTSPATCKLGIKFSTNSRRTNLDQLEADYEKASAASED